MAFKTTNMTKSFEAMENGVHAGFEAGRKAQKAWFDACTQVCTFPGFEGVFPGGERIANQFVPMVANNFDNFTNAFDRNVKTNFEAVRRVSEVGFPSNGDQVDVHETTRTFWDVTFDAARQNFEVLTNATRTSWENVTNVFQQGECSTAKPAPKSGK